MDNINSLLNEYIQQQIEYEERVLSNIIQNYDFIVGSKECKYKLMEILPKDYEIICSPYINSPTMIYAIKRFELNDLLLKDSQKENER